MQKQNIKDFTFIGNIPMHPRPLAGMSADKRLWQCFAIDAETFADAIASARRENVCLDFYLLTHGMMDEEELYRGIAYGLGLPFCSEPFDIKRGFRFELMLASGFARLLNNTVIAAPRGIYFEDLLLRMFSDHSAPPLMITTPSIFRKSLLEKFGKSEARQAVKRLEVSLPEFSARETSLVPFIILVFLLPALYIAAVLLDHHIWTVSLYSFSTLIAAPSLVMKAAFLLAGRPRITLPQLPDAELPNYTIMLPLYREAESVAQLLHHILTLDYPRSKLQILLLVEDHDHETLKAISISQSLPCFEIIICPKGLPQTKPRALAIGMTYLRGDLVVIYDAEDLPDRMQLKRAAAFFSQSPSKVACVQASLAIYNHADSWLTRMFSLEYSILFDVILPGMARLNVPIPLGGTSNHLRRDALEAVKGWDPWNVTEDADLGLRLKYFGYETRWLPSTTYEEAPFEFRIWFAQRTRWFKGWMQTAIVHVGRHHMMTKDALLFDRISLDLVATVSFVTALYHPLPVIIATELILNTKDTLTSAWYSSGGISLLSSLLICHLILNVILTIRSTYLRMVRLRVSDFLLQLPYSVLRSIAAWRALFELMIAPSYWHKTPHGRARSFDPPL